MATLEGVVVLAALIGVVAYALYLGRHLKIGLKTPLGTFFFETDNQAKEIQKPAQENVKQLGS